MAEKGEDINEVIPEKQNTLSYYNHPLFRILIFNLSIRSENGFQISFFYQFSIVLTKTTISFTSSEQPILRKTNFSLFTFWVFLPGKSFELYWHFLIYLNLNSKLLPGKYIRKVNKQRNHCKNFGTLLVIVVRAERDKRQEINKQESFLWTSYV